MWALFEAVRVGIGTFRFTIYPVLESAKLYFDSKHPKEQDAVVKLLLQLRSLFPSEVDAYLAEAPKPLRLRVYRDFQQLTLGKLSSGMQWGVPWLYMTVPAFRGQVALALAELTLNSTDSDRDIPRIGREIITFPMVESIAHALATLE